MGFCNNKVLSDELLVRKLRHAARIYYQYVDKDVLVVYAKSKQGPFHTYEFHAGKENFQHLAGVKSPDGAAVFFDKCIDDGNILSRKDIVPKDNIKVTSAKIGVLSDALNLKKSKAYKFGHKDLITLKNVFDMAIGNIQSVMGFSKRSYCLPVPVTVMDRSIYEFCSEVESIYLIMLKEPSDAKYSVLFYEITKDILHKADFGYDVLKKINIADDGKYS